MMAATPAAEAEVVSSTANISVPRNGGLIQFDINRDGQMDFGLSYRSGLGPRVRRAPTCSSDCGGSLNERLKVVPAQAANEVWQTEQKAGFLGSSSYCAAGLGAGRHVNGAAPFKAGNRALFWLHKGISGTQTACPWLDSFPQHPYLGVNFLDKRGKVHYGWVRVELLEGGPTIVGYAYETIPNKPITTGVTHGPVGGAQLTEPEMTAPQNRVPSSLGMLALGAPGLAAWRRPEEEQPAE
jgi:hypothetical protein